MSDGRKITASQLLEHFMFPSKMQYTYVSKLSGGEKRRLYLLTVLMKNPNFLILDEPTNDLDVSTLRSLEEGLINFGGCAVVISHDRWFLDRVATHILAFENDEVIWFEGNYETFKEYMKKQKGDQWKPTRVKYRPIS